MCVCMCICKNDLSLAENIKSAQNYLTDYQEKIHFQNLRKIEIILYMFESFKYFSERSS